MKGKGKESKGAQKEDNETRALNPRMRATIGSRIVQVSMYTRGFYPTASRERSRFQHRAAFVMA